MAATRNYHTNEANEKEKDKYLMMSFVHGI